MARTDRVVVRASRPQDLEAITAIYAWHVRTGEASFEHAAPDLEEIARRRGAVLASALPHLVAEWDGAVAGFAYAAPYHPRAGFRHTLEDSVYVAPEAARRGVGRALLAALLRETTALGYRQMVAVIGDGANAASIALHAGAGFRMVGTLTAVGRKHGRWLDVVLMQRALGPGDTSPPAGG